jgi:hypothetical protein
MPRPRRRHLTKQARLLTYRVRLLHTLESLPSTARVQHRQQPHAQPCLQDSAALSCKHGCAAWCKPQPALITEYHHMVESIRIPEESVAVQQLVQIQGPSWRAGRKGSGARVSMHRGARVSMYRATAQHKLELTREAAHMPPRHLVIAPRARTVAHAERGRLTGSLRARHRAPKSSVCASRPRTPPTR